MEQWEKEYLEIVQSRNSKRTDQEMDSRSRKDYINACWEEIEKPSGEKWYVPKPDAIKKRAEKDLRRARMLAFCRCAKKVLGGAAFIIVLGFVLFFAFTNANDSTKQNDSISRPVLQLPTSRQSYIDGYGMRDMVETLSSIRSTHVNLLNSYVSSGNAFSTEELQAWQEQITSDHVKLVQLKYDSSYHEVVQEHFTFLSLLQDYINFCSSGDLSAAHNTHVQIVSLVDLFHEHMLSAMKKNGVQCGYMENGIWYRYKNY